MTNGFPFVSMIPVYSKKCRREHCLYPLFLAPLRRHAVQLCFWNTPTCRQGRVMWYPGDRMQPKASHPCRALSFRLLFYLNPHEYFTSYSLSLFKYINNDHIYSTLNHFGFPQKSWVNLMLRDDHCCYLMTLRMTFIPPLGWLWPPWGKETASCCFLCPQYLAECLA